MHGNDIFNIKIPSHSWHDSVDGERDYYGLVDIDGESMNWYLLGLA